MKKKISLIGCLLIATLMVISIGRTSSFWVKFSAFDNQFTIGKISAQIEQDVDDGGLYMPGSEVKNVVNVRNTGDVDAVIRLKLVKYWGVQHEDGVIQVDNKLSPHTIMPNYNTKLWMYNPSDGYYYYKGVLTPGELTHESLIDSFKISEAVENSYIGRDIFMDIDMECVQAGYDGASIWNMTNEQLGIDYKEPVKYIQRPKVTFMNPDRGFKFKGNTNDLLYYWSELIPGESVSQALDIGNKYHSPVPIYMKADYVDSVVSDDEKQLVENLLRKYVTISITRENGEVIYKGPIWGNLTSESNTMKNYIKLGDFKSDEYKKLLVNISVDTKVDNKYMGLLGKVKWIFQAEGSEDSYEPPHTGDSNSSIYIYIMIMVVAATAIVLLLIKRKNSKR